MGGPGAIEICQQAKSHDLYFTTLDLSFWRVGSSLTVFPGLAFPLSFIAIDKARADDPAEEPSDVGR